MHMSKGFGSHLMQRRGVCVQKGFGTWDHGQEFGIGATVCSLSCGGITDRSTNPTHLDVEGASVLGWAWGLLVGISNCCRDPPTNLLRCCRHCCYRCHCRHCYRHHCCCCCPDDVRATIGSDDIFKRDFSAPTGEDKFDKSMLPKVMQVRGRVACRARACTGGG